MKDSGKNIVPYELIVRSFSDDLSSDEENAMKIWLESDTENQSLLNEFKIHWNSLDKIKDTAHIDIEEEWKVQAERIARIDYKSPEILSNKGTDFWDLSKVAAVFVIFIIAATVIYYAAPFMNINESVLATSIQNIELPDGTKVTLNANTTLKYPRKFKKNSRDVILSGEAFFDVKPDASSPFIIRTENSLVKVLGTSFNVSAKTNQTIVTVESGKVSLSNKSNTDAFVLLEKGEYGFLDIDKSLLTKNVNPNPNFLSWKTRKIDFDNEKLIDAIGVLESVYQCKIEIKDTETGNCTITSSFDDQSLEAVLKVIISTLDLEIQKVEDTFVIEGNGC